MWKHLSEGHWFEQRLSKRIFNRISEALSEIFRLSENASHLHVARLLNHFPVVKSLPSLKYNELSSCPQHLGWPYSKRQQRTADLGGRESSTCMRQIRASLRSSLSSGYWPSYPSAALLQPQRRQSRVYGVFQCSTYMSPVSVSLIVHPPTCLH